MTGKTRLRIIAITIGVLLIAALIIFFRFFFTYEQRNVFQRKIDAITGMNLTVTIFGFDGRIIKRWTNVQKITTGRSRDGKSQRHYTYFYTKNNKYVQIPNSVWYVAEEE
jgi:ABC-type antimicrobial peptide transport system permease subunit